jgi:hypothetical protein
MASKRFDIASSWRMVARNPGASRGCSAAYSAMATISMAMIAAKAWPRGVVGAGCIVRFIP